MRRHAARATHAAPPGTGATPPPALRRGILSIDPEDWAWLHDLIRRRGETRR